MEEVDRGDKKDVRGKNGEKEKLERDNAEGGGRKEHFVTEPASSHTGLMVEADRTETAMSLVPGDTVMAATESPVNITPSRGAASHDIASSSDRLSSGVEHRHFDTGQVKAQGERVNRPRRKEGEEEGEKEGGGRRGNRGRKEGEEEVRGRSGDRGRKERAEEGGGGSGERGRPREQRQTIEGDRGRSLKENEKEKQENEKQKQENGEKNSLHPCPLMPSSDARGGALEMGRDAAELSGPLLELVTDHVSLEIGEDSAPEGKEERGRGRGSEEITSCLVDEGSMEQERLLVGDTVFSHTLPVENEDSRRGETRF